MNYCCLSVLKYSYRQGQATVLEALPLLKVHNIATKRPDDYFAEMAKSDQQMQKVNCLLFSFLGSYNSDCGFFCENIITALFLSLLPEPELQIFMVSDRRCKMLLQRDIIFFFQCAEGFPISVR